MNRAVNIAAIPPPKAKGYRTPLLVTRLFNYEYWPVAVLFFPAILYYFFLALRARSFTYFTAANPGIELGGFFGESKSAILKSIPDKYLPVSLYVEKGASLESVLLQMKMNNLGFPVICKPDKGERGYLVEKIENRHELEEYLQYYQGELIVQEYITHETELGILYYRFPDGSGSGISSVVSKEFLSVTGDGFSTVEQLILQTARARMQLPLLRIKMGDLLHSIPAQGEQFLLQPIGNHCLGTRFLNGEKLINEKLVKVFDEIASGISGFYFGRFDLKVKNIEALYKGEHIRIMELNGTTSEPAHIYGPDMTLIKAWKDILYHTKLVYTIAMQNRRRGIACVSIKEVIGTVYNHFKKSE